MLSIVAYAVVDGEAVMPELDGLELVATHSLQPSRQRAADAAAFP